MSLFLIILTAIGAAIFLIAFILIVVASFRHHTVTGFISLIPGINLVVLPTVLSKTGKAFPASIAGLGIALLAWYSGGNHYIDSYLKNKPIIEEVNNTETVLEKPRTESNPEDQLTVSHKTKQSPLPSKPLYYLVYTTIEYKQLGELLNKHIRIELIDGRQLEGKTTKVTAHSLLLETYDNNKTQVVKILSKHIRKIEKLIKK